MALMESLLNRTRLITRLLQSQSTGHVRFEDLASVLGEALNGRVSIISRKGKVLAATENARLKPGVVLDEKVNQYLLKLDEPTILDEFVLTGQYEGEPFEYNMEHRMIMPVFGGGERLGTLVVNKPLDEAGLVLAEYATAVVGMELLYTRQEEDQEHNRKVATAKMAVSALSFSEAEAIVHVFRDLGGTEGLLVASKIADRVGVTRSVIVNALRKLESAGVITSRSLGMKGTYIKVLNEEFLNELAKLS